MIETKKKVFIILIGACFIIALVFKYCGRKNEENDHESKRHVQALLDQGRLLLAQAAYSEAEQSFAQVIRIDPKNIEAREMLAELNAQMGNNEAVRMQCRDILILLGKSQDDMLKAASIYIRIGRSFAKEDPDSAIPNLESALRAYDQLGRRDEHTAALLVELVGLKSRLGKGRDIAALLTRADQIFTGLEKCEEQCALSRIELAKILFEKNQGRAGRRQSDKCGPQKSFEHMAAAVHELEAKKPRDAIQALSLSARMRGLCSDYAGAISDLNNAIRLHESMSEADEQLVGLYVLLGNYWCWLGQVKEAQDIYVRGFNLMARLSGNSSEALAQKEHYIAQCRATLLGKSAE